MPTGTVCTCMHALVHALRHGVWWWTVHGTGVVRVHMAMVQGTCGYVYGTCMGHVLCVYRMHDACRMRDTFARAAAATCTCACAFGHEVQGTSRPGFAGVVVLVWESSLTPFLAEQGFTRCVAASPQRL